MHCSQDLRFVSCLALYLLIPSYLSGEKSCLSLKDLDATMGFGKQMTLSGKTQKRQSQRTLSALVCQHPLIQG